MLQEGRPDVGFEPLAEADDPVEVAGEVTDSLAPCCFGNHRDGLGGESCPDLVGEFVGRPLGAFRHQRPDAGFAGRIRTLRALITQIKEIDSQITTMVTDLVPTLTDIYGIGTLGAAEILAQVGDGAKYRTKARFAMANGTAPLQASSGRVVRYRLNRGGNRRLNRTIHIAAVTQIRRPGTEGRLYYDRLRARGKTKKKPSAYSNDASRTAYGPTYSTFPHYPQPPT